MNDDDLLRRTLSEPTNPSSSYRVLEDLRPTMRRARIRRRAGVGAAAAILVSATGAGVLALTSAPAAPTVRTTPASDENGAVQLPPPPEVVEDADDDAIDLAVTPTTAATLTPATTPTTSAPEGDLQRALPESPPVDRSSDVARTPTTTGGSAPAAPPPTTAAPMSQPLTSACGELVVMIDGRTVRISSITPLPGYTPQVATDGPESVEMTFRGADRTCEIHAELKSNGLVVEIQGSDDD